MVAGGKAGLAILCFRQRLFTHPRDAVGRLNQDPGRRKTRQTLFVD